jgi:serine/threonine protein kinase
VYRAEDIRRGSDVALKSLPDQLASDAVALEGFRREASAASRINHPHICTVHDRGAPQFPRLACRIRIVDLHGATEGEITLSDAQDLQSLDWSAHGTRFFSADLQPETTRLLHVQRNGTSHVLLTQPPGFAIWGVPSPDGRYLATFKGSFSSNVWMVENP